MQASETLLRPLKDRLILRLISAFVWGGMQPFDLQDIREHFESQARASFSVEHLVTRRVQVIADSHAKAT